MYLCLTELVEIELFLILKLCIYAKPNCLKLNCFDIQMFVNKKLYLYLTELFEI